MPQPGDGLAGEFVGACRMPRRTLGENRCRCSLCCRFGRSGASREARRDSKRVKSVASELFEATKRRARVRTRRRIEMEYMTIYVYIWLDISRHCSSEALVDAALMAAAQHLFPVAALRGTALALATCETTSGS